MQIPNIFTNFSPKFFWQFFSSNQSCQQLKSPKPQHFHEFSPKTIRQFFSGKSKWIFGQKIKISNSVRVVVNFEKKYKIYLHSGWNQKDTRRRRLYWLDKLSGYSSTFAILPKPCPSYCLQSRSSGRRYTKVTRRVWCFSAEWSFIGATAYSFDDTGTWQRSSTLGQSQPWHHSGTFAGEHW